MEKKFGVAGAVLAGLAVIIGAFGAHTFRDFLVSSGRMDTYQTAVEYQFYHALALLVLSRLEVSRWVFMGLLTGVVIFSLSLYLLCFTQLKWFGAITPIGGVLMILGWTKLVFELAKQKRQE